MLRLIAVVMLMNSYSCECERRNAVISAKHLDVINGEPCASKPCTAPLTCVPSDTVATCRLVCNQHSECPEEFSCARFSESGPRPGGGRGVCARKP